MNEKFSKRVKDVLIYSKEEAERLGNSYVAPEHLLLGIFRDGEGPAIDLLLALNADIRKIKNSIEERVRTNAPFNFNQAGLFFQCVECGHRFQRIRFLMKANPRRRRAAGIEPPCARARRRKPGRG